MLAVPGRGCVQLFCKQKRSNDMSDLFELSADIREDVGKGASRRLRRSGKVPAVLYGGKKDSVGLSLSHSEIMRQLDHEAFYSHVLTINAGGKTQKAILRDVQRHPFKPSVLHLDFMRVMEDTAIRVNVPLHYINEDVCPGIKMGGIVSKTATEVEVECLPRHLPEYIDVDLASVEIGDIIHLTDIRLPEGVALTAFLHGDEQEHDQPIASINVAREQIDEEEEVDVEGLEGEVDEDEGEET